ncbi:hypothetical protein [Candidatus Uabimicrobium amorphum]|uniref:SH3b domain-containing protein n=1 Tax=Uabimicrobium amorphum TaxID=2596890 RepID=A0A5S9IWZ9_UABAM|nr:hypothetical protein [Candidatus Uabimicrobium amorphum]BBM88065.1 hypothetical protein UABAM_06481 [Candidatus Uabimicrobium amorphum]
MIRAIFLLLFLGLLNGETIYVKSKYASLYQDPSNKSSVVRVKRGTELQKLKKERRWLQIKYKGRKLWVYQGKVSVKKPPQDKSLLIMKDRQNDIAAGSAIRVFPHQVSSATRLSRQLGSGKYVKYMDYHQSFVVADRKDAQVTVVKANGIEMNVITTKDLEHFLARGKIGEYAGFREKR